MCYTGKCNTGVLYASAMLLSKMKTKFISVQKTFYSYKMIIEHCLGTSPDLIFIDKLQIELSTCITNFEVQLKK